MKGTLLFVFLVVMILGGPALVSAPASARTIYVPDDYPAIQQAVDNAKAGDTIIVRDGTYLENLAIKKNFLTIKSENGPANCILKTNDYSRNNVFINAYYVNISGFTVLGSLMDWWVNGGPWPAPYWMSGFYLAGSKYCNISSNVILYTSDGIELQHSGDTWTSYNAIKNNVVRFAFENGIELDPGSSYNLVQDNRISDTEIELQITGSPYNTLVNNSMSGAQTYYPLVLHRPTSRVPINFGIFTDNKANYKNFQQTIDPSNKVDGKPVYYWVNKKNQEIPPDAGYVGLIDSRSITVRGLTLANVSDGVLMVNSSSSLVASVNVTSSYFGIRLDNSTRNEIKRVNATMNGYGVALYFSSKNQIYLNNLSQNIWTMPIYQEGTGVAQPSGLNLRSSSDNDIFLNIISGNRFYGILLNNSNSNRIFLNNIADNEQPVLSEDSRNSWNSTRPFKYTYGGNTFIRYMGNYWSDYSGSDIDGDGIGETPYTIDANNVDMYPLVKRIENYNFF